MPLSPALVGEGLGHTIADAGARVMCVGKSALRNVQRSAHWLTGVERVVSEGPAQLDLGHAVKVGPLEADVGRGSRAPAATRL